MYTVMVFEIRSKKILRFTPHKFKIVPRKGDYITRNDEQGVGQAYRIIAVVHPPEPTDYDGELYIRHVGTISEFNERMKKGEI